MTLKYLGHSSFKIESNGENGKVSIVIDPFDPKQVGIKWTKQEANILLLTHDHADHKNIEGVEGNPFVIDTPGEYEVKGVHVIGFGSYHDKVLGKERGKNTIYMIETQEKIRIAHLGDLGCELTKEQIEELSIADILLVPVGGIYTIGPKEALEIIDQVEPYVVVPMHYKTPNHLEPYKDLKTVADFVKMSDKEFKPVDKLNFKTRGDLPEETEYYVME